MNATTPIAATTAVDTTMGTMYSPKYDWHCVSCADVPSGCLATLKPGPHLDTSHPLLYSLALGTSHPAHALCSSQQPSCSPNCSEHLLSGMHGYHGHSPQHNFKRATIVRATNRTSILNPQIIPAHDFASEETLKPGPHLDTSHPLLYSVALGTSHPAHALCNSQQPSCSPTCSEHPLRLSCTIATAYPHTSHDSAHIKSN